MPTGLSRFRLTVNTPCPVTLDAAAAPHYNNLPVSRVAEADAGNYDIFSNRGLRLATIIGMRLNILLVDIFVLFVFSFWIQRLIQQRRRNIAGLPLPPGPPGLPLLGNRFPKTDAWLQGAQWGKTYGKSQSGRK